MESAEELIQLYLLQYRARAVKFWRKPDQTRLQQALRVIYGVFLTFDSIIKPWPFPDSHNMILGDMV